ncbi:MAG: hypothetical protein Q7S46_11580, partial [Gallionella sp.]|nr:hypothetical protein [Gallionella sp.]
MILDSFKTHSAIIQIHYADAFLIWDRAGEINRYLSKIWPGVKVAEGVPQQVTLTGAGVKIQTGFDKSTITVSGEHALGQLKVRQICDTFEVWCKELEIDELSRVSTRVTYSKDFESLKNANAELLALNLVRWPDTKVFDQPLESDRNGLEVQYRFEDDNSFSILKLKAEQLKYEVSLDPNVFDDPEITKIVNRMIID